MPPKANSFTTSFDSLRDFVLDLYKPYNYSLVGIVKPEIQLREIELLTETLHDERFFFVIDMQNFQMQHCHGVSKWLGYSEKEFTLKKYWDNVVHPGSKTSLLLIIMKMYDLLSKGIYPLGFMVQRFSTKIVLKHSNGKYYQYKKTSSIFQHDRQNRLMAYMDEFTKIGEYKEDTGNEPRMYNKFGEAETIKQGEILKKALSDFEKMKVYSLKELQTARYLAYNNQMTQQLLAKKMRLSPYTIDTYCKRFLVKTRDFFCKTKEELPTTLQAANFLKQEGLI